MSHDAHSAWATLILCTLATSCVSDGPPVVDAVDAAPSVAELPRALEMQAAPTTGSIVGVAHLGDDIERPERVRINVSSDAYCKSKYPDGFYDAAFDVNADRTLPNVFAWLNGIKADNARWPIPDEPVRIVNPACHFEPRVVGVRTGQELEFVNASETRICFRGDPRRNPSFYLASAPGAHDTVVFKKTEARIPIACDLQSWMSATVFAMPHPFFDNGQPDGSFVIEDVPAGTHTLRGWHETFGSVRVKVEVIAERATHVELTFTGK